MRRITTLLFLLVVCFATAMQAQTPAPKPDPELKKLNVLVGHWTFEGEGNAGPWGPGGKSSGEYDSQMILGGFFFQGRWREKGAPREMGALVICGYDALNKNFVSNWYLSGGSTRSGTLTVSGNTFAWEGKLMAAGEQYQFKQTLIVAADLRGFTVRGEISADGKTWTPFFEAKYTKVQPAPKK